MSNLRGSRFPGAKQISIYDGAIEGFGSLSTAPPGFRLDEAGRLWETGPHQDQPSGFRMTEDGEIVEDDVAEGPGANRRFSHRPVTGRV